MNNGQAQIDFSHPTEPNAAGSKHYEENLIRLGAQCVKLVEHLERYGPLTNEEARNLYKIQMPVTRFWEIKAAGVDLKSRWIKVGTTKVKQYYL